MADSKPLDYRVEQLEKDGRVVDGFRVSGLLAELGLVVTRTVGTPALEAKHLPAYVELKLDGYRSVKKVQALYMGPRTSSGCSEGSSPRAPQAWLGRP